MIIGQSAATAAVLAVEKEIAVQALPYPILRDQLLKDGQVLEIQKLNRLSSGEGMPSKSLGG